MCTFKVWFYEASMLILWGHCAFRWGLDKDAISYVGIHIKVRILYWKDWWAVKFHLIRNIIVPVEQHITCTITFIRVSFVMAGPKNMHSSSGCAIKIRTLSFALNVLASLSSHFVMQINQNRIMHIMGKTITNAQNILLFFFKKMRKNIVFSTHFHFVTEHGILSQ